MDLNDTMRRHVANPICIMLSPGTQAQYYGRGKQTGAEESSLSRGNCEGASSEMKNLVGYPVLEGQPSSLP